jgi:ribosomal protein L16 Arg81 hydroxylase
VPPHSESWLSALLEPVSVEEFLSRYWLKEHLLGDGSAGRFAPLLSWPVLNRILEHHCRETYRFRLAKQGRDLDPASFADLERHPPRIRAKDVTDALHSGATLSFTGIDEVHEPLTRLAESFEAFFGAGTNINIYAGWRALHGLDLHRDDQDVFILHVDGRKRWLLYGFSVDGIDQSELGRRSVPPAGAVLDEILTPGDLLYIPRGAYHLAVPMNEPTLHLTVSVKYSDELRQTLLQGFDRDLVEQSETGVTLKPRPSFSLPWSATPERLPPGRGFHIRLAVHSPMVVKGDSDAASVELRCRGRRYRFPRGMRWIVEHLDERAPLPIDGLIASVAGRLDEDAVRLLVAMLVREGLVAITV